MKLRVRHNSVRLRLGRSDVRSLRDGGRCRETILFPGGSRLEYVLLAGDHRSVLVSFAGGVVSIAIPEEELAAWHSSEQIGIQASVEVYPGKKLEVLIEKDFQCLDPRVIEDQSDGFENPPSTAITC